MSLAPSGLWAQREFAFHQSLHSGYRFLGVSHLNEATDEFRRAVAIASEMHDELLLSEAFTGEARAAYYRSDFRAAIDTISFAIAYYRKMHRRRPLAECMLILTNVYEDQGNYEKAFAANRQIESYDSDIEMEKQVQFGNLYTDIEDYSTALLYYTKGFEIPHGKGEYPFRELNHRLARLYAIMGNFDSARYFYDQSLIGNPNSKSVHLGLGEYFNLRGRYDSALFMLLPLYREMDSTGEGNIKMAAMIGIARAYVGQHAFDKAVSFAQAGYDLSNERGVRQYMRDAAFLLSGLYDTLGNRDLAYVYYKKYVVLKDSIVNGQLRGQLTAFKYDEEARSKLAAEQMRWRVVIAFIVVAAAAVLFLLIFRNLRISNERLTLKKRAADLEMQALRTQMNPHFIFNALSSINGFILNNQPTEAADYLARFSRLVRLVLELSSKQSILLQDEIQLLRLYLEMESLRFRDRFTWQICHEPELGNVLVPPLIFQPFCENAIWHGLLHKDAPGFLSIEFSKMQDVLSCIITDNGVGRAASSAIGRMGKAQPMGLNITAERLGLFNQSSFEIEDLDEGTRVNIKIRLHD